MIVYVDIRLLSPRNPLQSCFHCDIFLSCSLMDDWYIHTASCDLYFSPRQRWKRSFFHNHNFKKITLGRHRHRPTGIVIVPGIRPSVRPLFIKVKTTFKKVGFSLCARITDAFESDRWNEWIDVYFQMSVRLIHGPLAKYANLRVAHAPGMPGTFSPPPRVSDPDMHHGTCVMHVPGCMLRSLTSGFLWRLWRGKRSRHSRRMRNPQFYLCGKRPIGDHSELEVSTSWKRFPRDWLLVTVMHRSRIRYHCFWIQLILLHSKHFIIISYLFIIALHLAL